MAELHDRCGWGLTLLQNHHGKCKFRKQFTITLIFMAASAYLKTTLIHCFKEYYRLFYYF